MTDRTLLLPISECCHKPVATAGKGTTHWYICTACHQPTNPARP